MKWTFPLQLWQMTPLVQPVEVNDEELFAGTTVLLFSSGGSEDDSAAKRALDMKGAADRAGEGSVDFPVADAALVSVKLLFDFSCRPCNSLSAFIER
ncbi:hypothetical protein GUJ93_ZPchr0010g9600 [Zizania palustris]|uniref:Uncharacterized protein n=1 Tax=Zizania palustris TaxID=103762 RepID=A0A8J6BRJ8_ZIZPA|nr:hypothetical protein GUJ93_ZPchr0010g9600 [Zizania palustris]